MSNKKFWSTVKPFLTNKGGISNDFISVEKDGDLISNEKEIVKLFNQNYMNIVENSMLLKMNLPLKKLYQHIVTILAFKK